MRGVPHPVRRSSASRHSPLSRPLRRRRSVALRSYRVAASEDQVEDDARAGTGEHESHLLGLGEAAGERKPDARPSASSSAVSSSGSSSSSTAPISSSGHSATRASRAARFSALSMPPPTHGGRPSQGPSRPPSTSGASPTPRVGTSSLRPRVQVRPTATRPKRRGAGPRADFRAPAPGGTSRRRRCRTGRGRAPPGGTPRRAGPPARAPAPPAGSRGPPVPASGTPPLRRPPPHPIGSRSAEVKGGTRAALDAESGVRSRSSGTGDRAPPGRGAARGSRP